MNYEINKQEHYAIMTIKEEFLNSLISPELKSQLVIFFNEGIHNLILNLEHVEFVDSSGLSAILTANRLWGSKGTFALTSVRSASVSRLISISRLDDILKIFPSVEESIDYVVMNNLNNALE
jgi:anti-sigma B factor antagonist